MPTIEISEEMIMSTIIAVKSGLLGLDFQKLPLSRTTKIVNSPPKSNISKTKVFNWAVLAKVK